LLAFFDILRSAVLPGFCPEAERFSLTGKTKFDIFERFAQKRRGMQETAERDERRQVRGHPGESLGLDPTSPLRWILARIFDKLVEHASREKESGFGLIVLTR
jgi:hypothetical protein